jgi:hypothetical protein
MGWREIVAILMEFKTTAAAPEKAAALRCQSASVMLAQCQFPMGAMDVLLKEPAGEVARAAEIGTLHGQQQEQGCTAIDIHSPTWAAVMRQRWLFPGHDMCCFTCVGRWTGSSLN